MTRHEFCLVHTTTMCRCGCFECPCGLGGHRPRPRMRLHISLDCADSLHEACDGCDCDCGHLCAGCERPRGLCCTCDDQYDRRVGN